MPTSFAMPKITERSPIGLVGLGELGTPIARHLAGSWSGPVLVFDRCPKRREAAAAHGCRPVMSAAHIATAGARAVLVLVRDGDQAMDVIFSPDGLLSSEQRPDCVALLSTVGPALIRAIEKKALRYGVGIIDAPVSGGVHAAESARLMAMLSGPAKWHDQARRILRSFCTEIHEVGDDVGNAQAVKLANQVAFTTSIVGTHLALQMAEHEGVNGQLVRDILRDGTGACWAVHNWDFVASLFGPRRSTLALLVKDLNLAAEYLRTPLLDDLKMELKMSERSVVTRTDPLPAVRVKKFTHASVFAKELDTSVRFYVDVLGMIKLPTPDFGFPVQWMAMGDHHFHVFQMDAEPTRANHIGVLVDDFNAAYYACKRLGILDTKAFGCAVRELPGGAVQMYVRDPSGNLIELNAADASALDSEIRANMVRLVDQIPQSEEGLRSSLSSVEPL